MSSVPISADASPSDLTPFQQLRALVQADMEKVNAVISEQIENEIDLIPDISGYTIDAGGKRLRPMLTLAAANMCGYDGESHITLATSVEFMHTATLLHDDVVDDSDLRRNRKTAKNLWGNKASILVGDYLLGKAFTLMVVPQSVKVLEILSHAAMVISEGEVLQLASEGTLPEDDKIYNKIIHAKTAALFAAACEVGAVVAGVDDAKCSALRNYGEYLGRAFQIVDDALDYMSSGEAIGKEIGDDFRDRKATLPVILAYQQANDVEKAFWQRTIVDGEQISGDCQHAIDYINQHHAIDKTLDMARDNVKKAIGFLDVFEPSKMKQTLINVAAYTVDRKL